MILSFYIYINLLASLIFFKCLKKNLHALEILLYWLLSTLLIQNYSAFNYINFHQMIIPEILSLELTHFLNRTVLGPLIIVWFLNYYVIVTAWVKKVVLLVCFVFILLGLEFLEDRLGVCIYNGWKLWWSLAVWLLFILLSIGFMKLFRKKLTKGVQPS
ncbi:MAG: hypothetical protein K0S39_5447 [Paenibacillus sp.]|nr:hypothetical protein [Paenibacillus sp.]